MAMVPRSPGIGPFDFFEPLRTGGWAALEIRPTPRAEPLRRHLNLAIVKRRTRAVVARRETVDVRGMRGVRGVVGTVRRQVF